MLIAIVSRPKKGKTVSSCTFPKPMLLLDIGDRGFESVKHSRGKDMNLVVPDWNDITVVELYRRSHVDLNFISFASTGDKSKTIGETPAYAEGAMEVIREYNSIMNQLFDKGTVTIDGVEKGPFKSLVIDPLSSMFRVWKSSLLQANKIGELRRGDYMALEGILADQFIPNLKVLTDRIPYIILTDHEDSDTNEDGNVISEFPVGPSKNLGRNLSGFLDNIWRMDRDSDGIYTWRTVEHGRFRGAGSRLHLPDPIKPATFKRLKEIMKERGVELPE